MTTGMFSSVLVASSMWHMACQNQHSPCMCACRYIHMSHAVTTNTHTQTNVHTPIASGVAPPKHVAPRHTAAPVTTG